MSSPEINSVLAQMRVLAQDLHATDLPAAQRPEASGPGFAQAMQQAVESVNTQQSQAGELVNRFETGAGDTSVAEVMVAMQKASVSFQAMTEVRNRLVEAYREIMSMPL